MISTNQMVKESYFPRSDIYFCKIALEEKFKRKFRLKEVRELIKDMPKTLTASNELSERAF